MPKKPWHTLESDLFFRNNSPYLLVSDYYNKVPLVSIQSDTTIVHLEPLFEKYGISLLFITSNGTQFTSTLFQEFSKSYSFVHVMSSPYFPKANGFIERTVEKVKSHVQKCKEPGSGPYIACCACAAPLSTTTEGDNNGKLQRREEKLKLKYDKTSKQFPVIHPDDPVCVLNLHSHKWEPGIVKYHSESPPSYVVDVAAAPAGVTAAKFALQEKMLPYTIAVT